jgi:hypothetical protein
MTINELHSLTNEDVKQNYIYQLGLQQGIETGGEIKTIEVISNLLKLKKISLEEIAFISGASIELVKNIEIQFFY